MPARMTTVAIEDQGNVPWQWSLSNLSKEDTLVDPVERSRPPTDWGTTGNIPNGLFANIRMTQSSTSCDHGIITSQGSSVDAKLVVVPTESAAYACSMEPELIMIAVWTTIQSQRAFIFPSATGSRAGMSL